jgi:hypothetical protein
MVDADPPTDDTAPAESTAPLDGRSPKRKQITFRAAVAVVTPVVGLFATLLGSFQPVLGQGVAAFVLTALGLLLILLVVVLVRWWRAGERRRAILAVLMSLLVVISGGAGVAVGTILRAPDTARLPPTTDPSSISTGSSSTTSIDQSTLTPPTPGSGGTSLSLPPEQFPPTTNAPTGTPSTSVPFAFDQVREVPWCRTLYGSGVQPPEGAVVLMITQADEFKLYYEKEAKFDGSGRWRAGNVVIGNPTDRTDFYVIAYAVTPAKVAELEKVEPGVPVAGEPGRQLEKMLVTRVPPDECG